MCSLDDNDDKPSDHNRSNGSELRDNEETIQSRASLGADRIRHTNDHQNQYRQELMPQIIRLIGNSSSRVNTLDKDDAKDGQCRRHHSDDPRPSRQETEDIAKDIP